MVTRLHNRRLPRSTERSIPSPCVPTLVPSSSDSAPVLIRVKSLSPVVVPPEVAVVVAVRRDLARRTSPVKVAARAERLSLTITSSPPYEQ